MSTISTNYTSYNSNNKCSYCGSSNIQYKAKDDTTEIKKVYLYLCAPCWTKMKKDSRYEFYNKI